MSSSVFIWKKPTQCCVIGKIICRDQDAYLHLMLDNLDMATSDNEGSIIYFMCVLIVTVYGMQMQIKPEYE